MTANRWATRIETHKTKEGRILCTGIGCVGCFPEKYETDASELGICDVDLPVYSLRPWLNVDKNNNKSEGSAVEQKQRRKKGISKKKAKTKREDKKAISKEPSCEENKHRGAKNETKNFEVSSDFVDTRQPKDSTVQIENLTSNKVKQLDPFDDQLLSDILDFDQEEHSSNDVTSNSEKVVRTTPTRAHLTGEMYDNMYVVSDKNIALSLQDDCLPSRSFSSSSSAKPKQSHPDGEDAVCFFFAIEYYGSPRVLPVFKVVEIVEALSKTVALADIKCVQRVNHCWRIVLRSRKYTSTMRTFGIKLRGRVYEMIDDTDSYFDVA